MAVHAHHITLEPSTARVRIEHGGTVIAESTRPLLLHEGKIPVRYYLPREDVQVELIGPTDKRTHCPFKGDAAHYSVRVGDTTIEDAAWCYLDPIDDVREIAGLVAFYPHKVEIVAE